jgi:2-keto-4-pentenoate hydratase
MALTKDDIRLAAERLHQAEKTKQQIRQLSQDYPAITIEDAYAIQKAWIEIKVAEGRVVKGHSSDRDPQRRHDSSRLWALWPLRLIRTEK